MNFAFKLGTVKHFRPPVQVFATWCYYIALYSGPVDFGRQQTGPLTQSEKSPSYEVNVSDQGRGSSSRSTDSVGCIYVGRIDGQSGRYKMKLKVNPEVNICGRIHGMFFLLKILVWSI